MADQRQLLPLKIHPSEHGKDLLILGSREQADSRQASGVADAVRIYRAVLEREPQPPQASCALGVNDASAGDNEEASSLFETAIEVNPTE